MILHDGANLGLGIMSARSTLVMLVANNVHKFRWPAKILDLNSIDHLLDLLKHKLRAQPLQLNLSELAHVIL